MQNEFEPKAVTKIFHLYLAAFIGQSICTPAYCSLSLRVSSFFLANTSKIYGRLEKGVCHYPSLIKSIITRRVNSIIKKRYKGKDRIVLGY
jgi:hypothetical protein